MVKKSRRAVPEHPRFTGDGAADDPRAFVTGSVVAVFSGRVLLAAVRDDDDSGSRGHICDGGPGARAASSRTR